MNQLLTPFGVQAIQDASKDIRKAALLLHAMLPDDRNWLLSKLPEPQRKDLQVLQDELKHLGMPLDHALLQEVVFSPSTKGVDIARSDAEISLKASPRDAMTTLREADPEILASLLKKEPMKLVVRLIEADAWPWTARVMEQLDEPARTGVQKSLRHGRAAQTRNVGFLRSDQILFELLAERLRNFRVAPFGRRSVSNFRTIGWGWFIPPIKSVIDRTKKIASTVKQSLRRADIR